MKRIGLFIYAITLFIIGFVYYIPLICISVMITKEYSRGRIWALERFLEYQYEYRYRVLQLTTKEDGVGYDGLNIIDSNITELEELLYETKQGKELGYN